MESVDAQASCMWDGDRLVLNSFVHCWCRVAVGLQNIQWLDVHGRLQSTYWSEILVPHTLEILNFGIEGDV
jgi:hypothetical protein